MTDRVCFPQWPSQKVRLFFYSFFESQDMSFSTSSFHPLLKEGRKKESLEWAHLVHSCILWEASLFLENIFKIFLSYLVPFSSKHRATLITQLNSWVLSAEVVAHGVFSLCKSWLITPLASQVQKYFLITVVKSQTWIPHLELRLLSF